MSLSELAKRPGLEGRAPAAEIKEEIGAVEEVEGKAAVTVKKGVFVRGDVKAFREFLDKGVSNGTARTYASKWKWWSSYVELWAEEEGRTMVDNDLYLESLTPEDRTLA